MFNDYVCLACAYVSNMNKKISGASSTCTREIKTSKKYKAMKSRQNYSSPRMTVLSSKLRATILAGSGIGGKNTGEDFPFGSRERQSDVQTTNID